MYAVLLYCVLGDDAFFPRKIDHGSITKFHCGLARTRIVTSLIPSQYIHISVYLLSISYCSHFYSIQYSISEYDDQRWRVRGIGEVHSSSLPFIYEDIEAFVWFNSKDVSVIYDYVCIYIVFLRLRYCYLSMIIIGMCLICVWCISLWHSALAGVCEDGFALFVMRL